ncbi:MAG: FecR domain-containing protein [Acidobacteriota bacterium]|nr:FecR domain-containing protein [Acidobacteriota bacterium]
MKLGARTLLTVAALTAGAAAGLAQPVISARSGMISKAEGDVFLGDKAIEESQASFPEVKENQVLSTKQGRAEVLLTRGVYMRIGENSAIKMFTNRLIDTRLEILSGSAVVEAADIVKDNNLTILAGDATVAVVKHGLYRFDMADKSIKVYDGTASVALNGQTTLVGQGRLLRVENGQPVIEKFNKDDTDALDNWSRRRAEQVARANPSSAKQIYDSGCGGWQFGSSLAGQVGAYDPYGPCTCGGWQFNPWYGLVTYVPCGAAIYSPYGFRYWGPMNVMQAFYLPPQYPSNYGGGGGGGNYFPSAGATAGGYAGAMSSSSSMGVSSSSAASATTGTTSSSSAGSSSAGHGSSGGHGK